VAAYQDRDEFLGVAGAEEEDDDQPLVAETSPGM
jgi:hypothetical protein